VRGVPLRSAKLLHRPADWDRVKEEGVDIADRMKAVQDVNLRRLQRSITEMDDDITAQRAVLRALDSCDVTAAAAIKGGGGSGDCDGGNGKQSSDTAAARAAALTTAMPGTSADPPSLVNENKLLIHRNNLESMLSKVRHCLP
jgi:hypothetical protein